MFLIFYLKKNIYNNIMGLKFLLVSIMMISNCNSLNFQISNKIPKLNKIPINEINKESTKLFQRYHKLVE